jgi:hypothetical protein
MPSDDLQRIWQRQPVTATPIEMEQIRRKAGCLHDRVRARNRRETIAGVVAIALLTWFTFGKADALQRASFVLLIAGMLYVLWHLWRHGRASELPSDLGATDAVTFHVRQLTRQRDLLRGILWWYLAPFCPGWAVGAVSAARRSWVPAAILAVFVTSAMWLVWWLNRRAADRLDRQIAELTSFKELQ